jgi:hypothetical protein
MTRAPQALALKSIRPTVLAGSHAFSRGGMGPLRKIATLAVAATLAALCGAVVARAEVRVSCTPDHVVVRTEGAMLAEILAGLEATCRTRIELNGATSRQFIGVYSGSLRDVLSRLLVAVDHIVHSAAGRISIAIDPQNAAYARATAASPDNDVAQAFKDGCHRQVRLRPPPQRLGPRSYTRHNRRCGEGDVRSSRLGAVSAPGSVQYRARDGRRRVRSYGSRC